MKRFANTADLMRKYPDGTVWQGNDGVRFGTIEAKWRSVDPTIFGRAYDLMFEWVCQYEDGSREFRWYGMESTYASCREQMPIDNKIKFKRVKKEEIRNVSKNA